MLEAITIGSVDLRWSIFDSIQEIDINPYVLSYNKRGFEKLDQKNFSGALEDLSER